MARDAAIIVVKNNLAVALTRDVKEDAMRDEDTTLEEQLELRDELVEQLMGSNRRIRQEASKGLAAMAHEDIELVSEVSGELIDALELPEAQTRWQCLDALSEIALVNPEVVLEGFDGAENALFDEGSAAVRLSAFRFLARYGMGAPERSSQVWSVLREALQCYHGDPEYREMMVCMLDFARGDLDDSVRDALVSYMSFDAKNGRGTVRRYAIEMCAVAKGEA